MLGQARHRDRRSAVTLPGEISICVPQRAQATAADCGLNSACVVSWQLGQR
jgi:hypothetical protein